MRTLSKKTLLKFLNAIPRLDPKVYRDRKPPFGMTIESYSEDHCYQLRQFWRDVGYSTPPPSHPKLDTAMLEDMACIVRNTPEQARFFQNAHGFYGHNSPLPTQLEWLGLSLREQSNATSDNTLPCSLGMLSNWVEYNNGSWMHHARSRTPSYHYAMDRLAKSLSLMQSKRTESGSVHPYDILAFNLLYLWRHPKVLTLLEHQSDPLVNALRVGSCVHLDRIGQGFKEGNPWRLRVRSYHGVSESNEPLFFPTYAKTGRHESQTWWRYGHEVIAQPDFSIWMAMFSGHRTQPLALLALPECNEI